jgi:hypothetical protein
MSITNFDDFERVYESVERGESLPELNEGILTGIMNFFSKVFGGRVTELDRILDKYKRNEGSYWKKWSEANHEYNKANALRDSSEDNIERQKYMEKMERASKLIKQTTKTRDEINSALDRQAILIIRDNRRLRTYWEVKKAKAEEEVANKSYTSLKKEVDDDTIDLLYDNARKAQKRAQEKVKQMPKGTMTIDFGKYEDRSKEGKLVPMNKFGIHDVDDFLYASDEIWHERIKLMPDANKAELKRKLERAIESLKADAEREVDKYKKSMETASDDEKSRIKSDLQKVEEFAKKDEEILTSRMQQVESASDSSAVTDIGDMIAAKADKISKKVGDVGTTELSNIMSDMESLYDLMPDEDRDEEKEVDIRLTQLVDYSSDIYKFRQDNKASGKLSGAKLSDLYKQFKKEFPK